MTAVDVEGIFRLSGSAKRIKDLQTIFDSPDRYGKGLDWTGYTVHDAANILRRYLNQLPEPIVPLDFYERFRQPLRMYQLRAGVGKHAQGMESQEHGRVVAAYQQLITELPALNRQLLLYILDLLAVFASKSDVNRMTAQNLAAIFQPGILSHPQHDMAPNEYLLSQDVLIFLIENQDNFLFGMPGTGINQAEKEALTPKNSVRRANSVNSAAGSFRLRKASSKSSPDSRHRSSPGVSSPGTPKSPIPLAEATRAVSGGLGRSNTVPSNHSPALTGHRFPQRAPDAFKPGATNTPSAIPDSPPIEATPFRDTGSPGPFFTPRAEPPRPAEPVQGVDPSQTDQTRLQAIPHAIRLTQDSPTSNPASVKSASRERKTSNLFPRSPLFGPFDATKANGEQRQPRKLQKRRIPGSANESAHSSQASFQAADDAALQHGALKTPSNLDETTNPFDLRALSSSTNAASLEPGQPTSAPTTRGLMPPSSPTTSLHSKTSATDASDLEGLDDPNLREVRKRGRFHLSGLGRSSEPLAPPPSLGQLAGARRSDTSLGSNKPRKSYTGDSQQTQTGESFHTAQSSTVHGSRRESGDYAKGHAEEPKKEGFLTKWKAKLIQSKDERDAERRAKSPPRLHSAESGSKASLSAFAHEHFSPRGRSMDIGRPKESAVQTGRDRPVAAVGQPQVSGDSTAAQLPPAAPVTNVAVPIATIPEHATASATSPPLDGTTIRTLPATTIEDRDVHVGTQPTVSAAASTRQHSEVQQVPQHEGIETRTHPVSPVRDGRSLSLDETTAAVAGVNAPVTQSPTTSTPKETVIRQEDTSNDRSRTVNTTDDSAHTRENNVIDHGLDHSPTTAN